MTTGDILKGLEAKVVAHERAAEAWRKVIAEFQAAAAIGTPLNMPVVDSTGPGDTADPEDDEDEPRQATRPRRVSVPANGGVASADSSRVEWVIMSELGRQVHLSARLRHATVASAGCSGAMFEAVLKHMVLRGTVVKTGERAGTRYWLPSQKPIDTSAPIAAAPNAAEPNGPDWKARLLDLTQRAMDIFADGGLYSYGDIAATLDVSTSKVGYILEPLLSNGTIVKRSVPGQPNRNAYRLANDEEKASRPVARPIEVPTFDAVQLRQKIESILRTGASYDVREIVRNARATVVYATAENVQPILEELLKAGRVRRIPFGSAERFQAVA